MSLQETPDAEDDTTSEDTTQDRAELRAQVELLEEENQRLRREYARTKRTQYRNTAIGLLVLGTVGLAAAVVFPSVRTVLITLSATALFGGILTFYLTPERFLHASIGAAIYSTLAANTTNIIDELGLQDTWVYVPLTTASGSAPSVRLFVPQHTDYAVPSDDVLESTFVITETAAERGIALQPTGLEMFDEFDAARAAPLATDPAALGDQLLEALVEQFEIVDSATLDTTEDTQLTVGISGAVYSDLDRFDHPVTSFIAVGIATGTECPVTIETQSTTDDRFDYRLAVRWHPEVAPS